MPKIASELLVDENGNAEKTFLPVDTVVVPPEIQLSVDQRTISVPDEEEYWYGMGETRQISTSCLSQFIQLAEQSPRRILQFVRRWGLLGLCEHSLPATHRMEQRDARERSLLLPYEGCTPEPKEQIADWRIYSRRVRAVLEAAERLHRGEAISDDSLWESIGKPRRRFVLRGSGDSLLNQKERLARAVNLQLAASGIQPIMHWSANGPTIGFGVIGAVRTTLFTALSMQLAFAVSNCKIAICSSCHQTYRPIRRTQIGQANYCPACREQGIDVRVRVQRHRDRLRQISG